MVIIESDKESIILDLKAYGEFEIAKKTEQLEENEIIELGKIAAKHIGKGGYISKTIVLGAIEYFEGNYREPKRKRRDMSFYTQKGKSKKVGFFKKILIKKTTEHNK